MSAIQYLGYEISVVAHPAGAKWTTTVTIAQLGRNENRSFPLTMLSCHEFDTEGEAIAFGLNEGKQRVESGIL